MQSRLAKLVSSVPLLHPTKLVLKNLSSKLCGSPQMVLFVILWEVLYSVSPLSWITSQNVFPDGLNLLSLEDMLSVTNTVLLITLQNKLVPSQWLLPQLMAALLPTWKFTNSRVQVLCYQCIMSMNLFMSLLIAASSMLFNASILSTSPQRTLFWKSMMVALKIFSKNFMMVNISLNLKNLSFGMSIVSLMILLHMLSNQMEVLFGPVRITMVMYNLILLLKDMVLLVLWHQSS